MPFESMGILIRIICLAGGYLVGCFQTAYIIGRLAKNIDIREHGSGNAGMTNMTRVLGAKYGMIVFVIDIFKAIIAYTTCWLIFDSVTAGLYAGLGVIFGHNFPIFLKFKGGKGIAASVGIIIMFDWKIAVIVFAIGLATLAITKYISLTSLLITGLFPFGTIAFGKEIEMIILCFTLAALAFIMHRGNIKRLISGTERKFSLKSKGKLEE